MANYYTSTIKKGSSGDDVLRWQQYLNKNYGYGLDEDGIFGDTTWNATEDFQINNGLKNDGIVGDETWGFAGFKKQGASSSTGSGSSTTNIGAAPTAPTFNTTATAKPNIGAAPTAPTFNTTATAKPVTDTTKWGETGKGQAALGNYNTAKDNVGKYGDFTYEDYQESQAVQNAGNALDQHLANKPGEYQSQWQTQLDALMNQIMNREKFSYNMNEDALYQQYKDNYIQQGKLAMGDTMGQAATMTGGYGNSYAQSVGQQAYQDSLDNLNDIVPELYAMALDRYNREGQDLLNQYGLVADREDQDYGRYRDTVVDWQTDRGYLQGRYDSERGFDYDKYVDDRNMDYTLHADGYQKLLDALGVARDDYYSGADMYYTEQANKNSEAWNQYQADEEARQYANTLLQQGYQNDFNAWEANANNAWKNYEADENARQYANSLLQQGYQNEFGEWEANTREQANKTQGGESYADTHWYATGTTDDKGNSIFRNSEGKTLAFGPGVNPYTGTKHSDTEYGTFSNGYQPNNIGGTKLQNSGVSTSITGKNQTIWQANGKYWLWRDDLNEYIEVDISDLD